MEERKTQTYAAALAGLLRDIGEFARWGGWGEGPPAERGEVFVRQVVPEQWRPWLSSAASAPLVDLAEQLARGGEAGETTAEPPQLLAVFCNLTAGGKAAPAQRYWPLRPLALAEKVIFAGPPQTDLSVVRDAYVALWQGFLADAVKLGRAHQHGENICVYLENLLLLLQRYTWCVPAAGYRLLPDVSMYDHGRITAALSACLLEQDTTTLAALSKNPRQEQEVALLVGGDLSGVQNFIYTITARGATSALRGRSCYLQLYQGGGNFYLLARPSDKTRLVAIQQQVSRILLAHHRGELYLALGYEALQADDFFDGHIAQQWDRLTQNQRQAKQRRFAELGAELELVFALQGTGGAEHGECSVCGREHPDITEDAETGTRKCAPCRDFEALGKDLRAAEFLWLQEVTPATVPENPLTLTPGGWQEVLPAFGLRAGLARRVRDLPAGGDKPQVLLALTDAAVGDLGPGSHTVVGRRFLVNVTPTLTRADIAAVQEKLTETLYPDTVKPFSVLELQARGVQRLGVLRMDVDNLGLLFGEGFGQQATLSRIAALSFAVNLFFEGWVAQLAEHINTRSAAERGDVLYSIYSGGDDLFFVGAWDAVVELAREIRVALTRFAADHPGIHASAGIALVGGKYPLYQAAADAGDAEHAAKGYPGKDAVTFLGQTLPWTKFGLEPDCEPGMDTVHGLRHRLDVMTRPQEQGGEGVSTALLRRLIRLQMQYETALVKRQRSGTDANQAGEAQGIWGPWMWRGYYSLKRMAGKQKTAAQQAVGQLAERLHDDHFRGIDWIGLAARWVELLQR
jgi:CRISPR-associated protein Csm1